MSMKSGLLVATLAVGVFAYAAPGFAADVTGILVDAPCYNASKANITNAHKDMGETCAQECAKKGNQVALVTKDGQMYEVMTMGSLAGENNAKLVPHMSHTVTLTGDVMDSKGKTKMIHATALKMISK